MVMTKYLIAIFGESLAKTRTLRRLHSFPHCAGTSDRLCGRPQKSPLHGANHGAARCTDGACPRPKETSIARTISRKRPSPAQQTQPTQTEQQNCARLGDCVDKAVQLVGGVGVLADNPVAVNAVRIGSNSSGKIQHH